MKDKPKFSVITPVYIRDEKRKKALMRAIMSVGMQTFDDYEMIVIDDGSKIEFERTEELPWLTYFKRDQHMERVSSWEEGFRMAKGEWFCLLDSDDQYLSCYLEAVNRMIEMNPEAKMFNFGSIHVHRDHRVSLRGTFQPKKLDVGHEVFGGGQIVNGTFVFHRSVYEDLGGYPYGVITDVDASEIYRPGPLNMASPFDFSAYAQMKFPELREFFMVNHDKEPNKVIRELGNPWGQDAFLFFKYTRKYHSEPVGLNLYVVYHK